jgi:hypothetical protein
MPQAGSATLVGESTIEPRRTERSRIPNPLSIEEFEALLGHALRIFNKYSSLYRASTHSSNLIGRDDYKNLLKFAELGLQKWDEDIEKQMAAFKIKPAAS